MAIRPNSARFLRKLTRALAYWIEQTKTVDDRRLPDIMRDLPAIAHIVEYGVVRQKTVRLSAELIGHCFPIIEHRAVFNEWIQLIQTVLPCLSAGPLQLRLRTHLGTLLRLDGRLADAVAVHQRVMQDAEALNDQHALAHAILSLGYDHFFRHEYEAARLCATRAAAIRAKSELPPDFSSILSNLTGLIQLFTGSFDAAFTQFAEAADYLESQGRLLYAARAVINMARAAESQEQYQLALQLYDRADALLERIDNKLGRQLVLINRGTVYSKIPDMESALETYLAVDTGYLRRIGHQRYRAMVATNIGDVLLNLDRLAAAQDHLDEAVGLWRSLEDGLMLANAVGTLGETQLRLGAEEEAAANLRAALTLLESYAENVWAQQLQHTFSKLMTQLGAEVQC